jgi:hypothetical protein
MEQERNSLFVALTRAGFRMLGLYIESSPRRWAQEPTRFLKDQKNWQLASSF